MKINRSGGARRSSGRPAGEPKKAIGHRVLVRHHAQLVQYLKEKEVELINNENMENILDLDKKKGIKLGQFTIYQLTNLSIFIQHESGEGAEFSIEEFEKAVKLFYQTNF